MNDEIKVEIDNDTYNILSKLAETNGVSVDEMAKRLIIKYIKEEIEL